MLTSAITEKKRVTARTMEVQMYVCLIVISACQHMSEKIKFLLYNGCDHYGISSKGLNGDDGLSCSEGFAE